MNSCTLHGYKDGIYSPCVLALLPDKKKPTYIRMLQFLQSSCNERNFTLSPATVHTDLEVTMISAVHYIWPEAVVALSNFHLCQAWYRKIQAFNLTRDYRDVKSLVGRWLRLVFALPTLSADSVRECFLTTLTDLMPDTTEANLFADYIYATYLHQDCSFPPIMWADILCQNVKTTNACEAFHRHFQSSLQTYHPNIFIFMEDLKVEQNRTSLKQRTDGPLPKRKKYASKEEQRASVAEKYKHGEIDIVGYLFKMSKVMQPARE